ncbi:hypothetical protein [Fictibacillus barbaricus]|uniref:Uncharacterized protein n=1 Tax=Fictibacillus barbaricus TaxID=182136 RepID=A0ABS2ZEC2_9BACL|nr:hypothetical protein [Fictibacillus barbaricus]MBN3545060.1 hypothetical protein [Fictibacillus barbaricus]GGB62061.1 hypothetical protein GCM10007199_29920 [Fictibacillus barbaricus]
MKDVSTQCVVHTLGVGVAVLLNIWSDKLTKPIKGKSAEVLSEEMAQNLGSVFGGIIKEAFDQPHVLRKMSFDPFWNLAFPCLLLFVSLFILGFICKDLLRSIPFKNDSGLDLVLKIILSISLVFSTVLVLIKCGQLLFLNVVVTVVTLIFFSVLTLCISSLFSKNRVNAD